MGARPYEDMKWPFCRECTLVVRCSERGRRNRPVHVGARSACAESVTWSPTALRGRRTQGLSSLPAPQEHDSKEPCGNGPRQRRRRRRLLRWRYLLVVPGLLACLLGVSVAGAALTPGNESFEAKWADWLRAHHAGLVAADASKRFYYSATAPAKGGQPRSLNKVPVTIGGPPTTVDPPPGSTPTTASALPGSSPSTTAPITTTTQPPGLQAPLPVPLVVRPALAGEGQLAADRAAGRRGAGDVRGPVPGRRRLHEPDHHRPSGSTPSCYASSWCRVRPSPGAPGPIPRT